jgi:hypothetical protein
VTQSRSNQICTFQTGCAALRMRLRLLRELGARGSSSTRQLSTGQAALGPQFLPDADEAVKDIPR